MKKSYFLGMLLTVCIVIVTFVFAQLYPVGMISYWKFDEGSGPTAFDSVDANHGTIYGATPTTGQVAGALSFDGLDDYVELPASSSILTDSPFTISTWIITEVQQGDYGPGEGRIVNLHREVAYSTSASIYAGGPAGGEPGDRDDICFLYYTGAAHKWLCYQTTSPVYHDGNPHLITATHDGSTVKLYYDGEEVRTRDDTFGTFGTATAKIGSFNGSERYFNGVIDEVAIFDRVLTPEEIQQHYQDGLHGLGYDVECVLPPDGLVSWWPGDENAEDIWDTNHGDFQNDKTYATGRVDQAFSFDGVDAYVDVGDIGLNGDWTIDFWAKLDTVARTIQYPIGMGPRAGITYGTGIFMAYSNNKWGVYDGLDYFLGSPTLANIWYHIAVTKSGTTYTAYLDGNYENSGTLGDIDINNLQIGRRIEPSGSVWYFNGLIDEVEIFNRALLQSEIQDIYKAGSAGKFKANQVTIDIKPGSYLNEINLGSKGVIPVAILSSACFNATTVDPDTVTLAGAGVAVRGKGSKLMAHEKDVNGDGLLDLVVQVDTENFNPDSNQDGVAVLTGTTYSGTQIKGSDKIIIVKE